MSVPGTPEAVAEIRSAVCQFAQSHGFLDEKVEAIKLAVSEAATNAVLHGYSDHAGEITVVAELEDTGAPPRRNPTCSGGSLAPILPPSDKTCSVERLTAVNLRRLDTGPGIEATGDQRADDLPRTGA